MEKPLIAFMIIIGVSMAFLAVFILFMVAKESIILALIIIGVSIYVGYHVSNIAMKFITSMKN